MASKHPQGNCPATGKECFNCHGTGHYTALCRCPKQGKTTVIIGTPAGPTTGNPATTNIAVIPEADTGSPPTGPPATVLTTHVDHLITQEGTGEAPHQNSTQASHITSNFLLRPEEKLPTRCHI